MVTYSDSFLASPVIIGSVPITHVCMDFSYSVPFKDYLDPFIFLSAAEYLLKELINK